jgi:hypothetical protein
MKKSMLCAGLMTILSATVYAEDSSKSMNVNAGQTMSGPINAQSNSTVLQEAENVIADTPKATDQSEYKGSTKQPDPSSKPVAPTPGKSSSLAKPHKKQQLASAAKKTIKASRHASAASTTVAPATSATTPATTTATPAAGATTPATSTATSATGAATPATSTATPATGAATPATSTATPATGAATPATSTATPAANTATPATGTTTPAAGTTTPAGATIPAVGGTATSTVTAPQPLNCNYRIPAETAHIEQTIVMKWAEKAAEQSFDFDHSTIDSQLSSLKSCYTEQGWQGFNDALQKSGNLNAIKSQQLMVSSMVNGESKVVEIKDNQWKVIIPMQVVYQNDKEKLTQPLTVNLVVGRKISGDLGIMQMIAIPRQTTTSSSTGATQPAPENTATPQTHQ